MSKLWASLGAVLAALFLAMVPATASAATGGEYPDSPGREITRWDQTFALQADGSVDVTLAIDFDFGNDPGHGPFLVIPLRQGYDDKYDRVYRVSNVMAASPTGAPANVYLTDERNWLTVRVGDENQGNVSGVQAYVISYTVHRVMNATTAAELGGTGDNVVNDEFYWNAVGDAWVIPISNATVTVTSPVPVLDSQCFAGSVYSQASCASLEVDGSTAVFTHPYLYPGQPFSVNLLYPPNSFVTEPELVESNDVARAFRLTWVSGIGALIVLAVGLGLLARKLSTSAIDQQYPDVTPGLLPTGMREL